MIPLSLVREEIGKLAAIYLQDASAIEDHGFGRVMSEPLRTMAKDLQILYEKIERAAEYLTPWQYAQAHDVEPATVRRWLRTGQLPATKADDGEWKIKHDAVRQRRPRLRQVV